MSFNVRIYGHAGLVAMKCVDESGQARSDSVYQLQMPYLWGQTIPVSGSAQSSAAAGIPAGHTQDITTILNIEVPDGQTIRYEVNPPNRNTTAGVNSPSLSGKQQVQFGAGWTISMIDASALA